MQEKDWEVKSTVTPKNIKQVLDVLLKNRGLISKKDRDAFLTPLSPTEYKPADIEIDSKALKKAITRIKKAVSGQELIVIFGDYDADGICATAIMWRALHALGAKVFPYIPDRFEDGYGINPHSVEKIKKQYPEVSLIVTVDNGIVAFEGIAQANKLGIQVIVTDHHANLKKLPDAFCIVHTTITSGAGISWFLSHAIHGYDSDLELAAIGVIADQLPLLGFNRSLAKHGIESLNETSNLGLKKLFATAGLLGKKIGTYEINFAIAPRINAAGRLAEGLDALRLLCTTDRARAEKLAALLNKLNTKRQSTVDEALKIAENETKVLPGTIVTAVHASYHEGIIGLIASRLTEKYYLPSIVFSAQKDVYKASARSISGLNIIKVIRSAEEFILEGGGHEGAAGFTIEAAKVHLFIEKIQEVAKPLLTDEVLKRKTTVDCELDFSLLNQETYDEILRLEPFGAKNPSPVFVTRDVEIIEARDVGESGKHKKLLMGKNGLKIGGIAFNFIDAIKKGKADIVYRLSQNEWRGNKTLELTVKEIK